MVRRIEFYESRIDEIENPWTIDPACKKGGCKKVEPTTRGRGRNGSAFFYIKPSLYLLSLVNCH
jgi:hypothetical protein